MFEQLSVAIKHLILTSERIAFQHKVSKCSKL